jgi:predicted membrane channel-forming protein YqfA (hemolysin III family)
MSLLWIVLFCVIALVWVISIVDVIRQHYSGGTTAAWLALIVLLPFVGSVIYAFTRKPTRQDAEQAYLAEADRRRSAGSRPL